MTGQYEDRPTDEAAAVARVCDRAAVALDELTAECVRHIRAALPVYESRVPVSEHEAVVREQLSLRLQVVSGSRGLDRADLALADELARRRARQGVSAGVLVDAFHVGDRELWRLLRQVAGVDAEALPEIASRMLDSLHAITTALAAAHEAESQDLHSHRVTIGQRLVDVLAGGDAGLEAQRLAHAVGLSGDGPLQAAVWRPWSKDQAAGEAHTELRTLARNSQVVTGQSGHDIVILAHERDLGPSLLAALPPGRIGLGLPRPGIPGAVESIADAQIAASAASRDEPVVTFRDRWREAAIASQAARFAPLIETIESAAVRHPQLAETVLAYADAGMSLTRTGKRLHIHPNTVAYRLARWATHAGSDPRTFAGLADSLAALQAARSGET